jgi:hypothetical protein
MGVLDDFAEALTARVGFLFADLVAQADQVPLAKALLLGAGVYRIPRRQGGTRLGGGRGDPDP